jgi:hypothetical protein
MSESLHSNFSSKNISIFWGRCPHTPAYGISIFLPTAQGALPPVSPPAYGTIGHVTSFDM